MGVNNSSNGQLRSFVERIERLEAEKKAISADINEVKAEAKHLGFDVKIINEIVKERRLSSMERQERAALLDIYRAAVGILDGTPLGDAARKRLIGETEPVGDDKDDDEGGGAAATHLETVNAEAIEGAREDGRKAADAGKRIIDNPFVAGDPRRAAWDEGHCQQTGTDGMEMPEAWRRAKKKKPDQGEGDAAGEGGDE